MFQTIVKHQETFGLHFLILHGTANYFYCRFFNKLLLFNTKVSPGLKQADCDTVFCFGVIKTF